ncbi:MAG: GNAT family N-acetyltransferase [Candidatus Hydrogenedens sp.]
MLNIREIREADIDKAVESLVYAFFDDGLVCYMFPEEKFRKEFITWTYERWLRLLMIFNSVFVDENVQGVAGCIPPSLYPHIPFRYIMRAGFFRAIPKLICRNFWRPLRAYWDNQNRTRSEVKEPAWILDILGVHPSAQGKGIGSALVQHVISCANRDKVPAYVITHKEKNIIFYEKNGFKLLNKKNFLPGGPPTCSLIYKPF